MVTSSAAFDGTLTTRVIRSPKPGRARSLRLPGLGRIIFTRDPGESGAFSSEMFATNVSAVHRDGDGQLVHEYDLGSGLVTNVGVTALANDFAWAQNCQTLKLSNFHATGTGTTTAAATDLQLQTPAAPTTTTAVTGTQTLVSAPNSQSYRTTATVSYGSTLAITEWGLFTGATLSSATGSPATAVAVSSPWTLTATGTPYTASTSSVQGEQQNIVKTGTTASYGLILSNTTSVLTIPAWYKTADGTAGTTPGSTEAFTLQPVMFDHKVFAAINVVSGDSISFTYSLLVASGG